MIICIGREFGSGGHEIGQRLAEQLGLPFYDRELVDSAIERCKIDRSTLEKSDERRANPWMHGLWYEFDNQELRGMSINDILFRLQRQVILEKAAEGGCVFVGRCADYILKTANIPCISVFIAAPFETRVARKMEQQKLEEREAISLVRKMDKERRNYYGYYTQLSWGKAHNYDLSINSAALGIEKTVEAIISYAKLVEG